VALKAAKSARNWVITALTCGEPRDENGILKYKKKPRKKTGNLVGRPRNIQRVSQASTSIAAESRVLTKSSQAI